jgi:hypothetical protein
VISLLIIALMSDGSGQSTDNYTYVRWSDKFTDNCTYVSLLIIILGSDGVVSLLIITVGSDESGQSTENYTCQME